MQHTTSTEYSDIITNHLNQPTLTPEEIVSGKTQENISSYINTSNLKIGSEIKNYKTLCTLLEEPIKNGDSKKAQLKNWARYFEFEKIKGKQSYIILDIYDEPFPIEDNRSSGNNSIYSKYIETILVNYLSAQEGNTKTFTRRNWWELLGMINKQYGKQTNKQLRQIDTCLTDFEINHFYQRCNRKLDRILITALTSLRRRRLIEWQYQTIIVRVSSNNIEEHHIASDNEIEIILRKEKQILTNVFNYTDIYQIFLTDQQKLFYQFVNEDLYKQYGYIRYYKRIKIVYNQENMIDALPETELQLQKLLLNNEVVNYLNDEAKKIKTNWNKTSAYYFTNNCPELYIKAQELLVNELIRPLPQNKSINIDQLASYATISEDDDSELDNLFTPINIIV